jgi:hygromycin-B 4-O-kinase
VDDTADLRFAARVLQERFGSSASAPTELARGAWSSAFGFARGGSEWVIRFTRYEEDLAKDRFAAGYASDRLPIPAVVEIGTAGNLRYAIASRVTGRFLEELDAEAFRGALSGVFDVVCAMRDADTRRGSGYGSWDGSGHGACDSWRSFLLDVGQDDPDSRTHGWKRALASDPAAEAVFDEAMGALTSLVDACPEHRNLVHNDLLHRNVFVDETGRVSGVIDWGNSLYGDSLYDVALLLFWSPWYPAIDEGEVLAEMHSRFGADEAHLRERVLAYQVHVGLDHIGYNAFLGPATRRDEMERVCERTIDLIRRI